MPGSADWPIRPHAPDRPDTKEMPGQLRAAPPRPGPDRADEARPADRPRPPDEPARWSRADLQQRLERLPPGHPSSPDQRGDEPDAAKRSYWTELPRFRQAWTDHVCRWPAERVAVAVDRSRDPEGSWRGDGNRYLSPDEHAQANDMIATVQEKEKIVTGHMTEIERENTYGGWLAGLKFARKGEERLKEKIADELGITPAMKPQDAISKLNDVIRYTFCFEPADYPAGYLDVGQRLEAREYRMVYSKNHWRDDPEYKGINTRWVSPDGQRFEVQFHTAESYHAKHEVTHVSYERIRNPLTSDDERAELEAFQRDVSHWIPVPEETREIPDYRVRGN